MRCIGDYDQTELLTNIADQIIIPSFDQFKSQSFILSESLKDLKSGINPSQLIKVQGHFESAYIAFQHCAQFSFGPAENISFRANINNFPLNIQEFEETLQNGNFNFNTPSRYDKGFPALDYLLFGVDTTITLILDTLGKDSRLLDFAIAIAEDMNTKAELVHSDWTNYRASFITNQGTDAGSSLSQLVNGLNQNFEITKRDRIGIPSGELTLNFPNPDKVEAPHSQISNLLAIASLKASQNLFLGKGFIGPEGEGLDDVLDHVDAKKGDDLLSILISQLYDNIINQLRRFNNSLKVESVINTSAVVDVFQTCSRQVVQTKTDLTSEMCISITYVDSPSDTD